MADLAVEHLSVVKVKLCQVLTESNRLSVVVNPSPRTVKSGELGCNPVSLRLRLSSKVISRCLLASSPSLTPSDDCCEVLVHLEVVLTCGVKDGQRSDVDRRLYVSDSAIVLDGVHNSLEFLDFDALSVKQTERIGAEEGRWGFSRDVGCASALDCTVYLGNSDFRVGLRSPTEASDGHGVSVRAEGERVEGALVQGRGRGLTAQRGSLGLD